MTQEHTLGTYKLERIMRLKAVPENLFERIAAWWEYPLHNQMAFRLKAALLARPGIIVTDIPQHLSSRSGRK